MTLTQGKRKKKNPKNEGTMHSEEYTIYFFLI